MQYYNEYVVIKRFKGNTISGFLNLPYGTVCQVSDCGDNQKAIVCDKGIVCNVVSDVAFRFFAQNDDGNGFERSRLTHAILKRLEPKEYDTSHQDRWDKVWDDVICQKYKDTDFTDHWLWNYEFYNAPLFDLQYIARLVGAK